MHIKKNTLTTKDSWVGNFLENKNHEYIEDILGQAYTGSVIDGVYEMFNIYINRLD
jgi:hypothetical protein